MTGHHLQGWWEDLSHNLLQDKLAMGLQAAEAKPREGGTSYQMRADSRGRYKPDGHESGHSFPSPAPGPPLCLSLGTGGSPAAHWVPQQGMLPRRWVQRALLEMVSAPKYYFCTVPQHCSSCLTLRLLFLLAVVLPGLFRVEQVTAQQMRRLKPLYISSPLLGPAQPLTVVPDLQDKVYRTRFGQWRDYRAGQHWEKTPKQP